MKIHLKTLLLKRGSNKIHLRQYNQDFLGAAFLPPINHKPNPGGIITL